jgi:hypothetical protein
MKKYTQFISELSAFTKTKANLTRSFVGYGPRASSGSSQRQAEKEKAARGGGSSGGNDKVWETNSGKWAASCLGHDTAHKKEKGRGPLKIISSKHIRYFDSRDKAEAFIREKCR